eukprot:7542949-Alexandrium_andersonii.AAC.1
MPNPVRIVRTAAKSAANLRAANASACEPTISGNANHIEENAQTKERGMFPESAAQNLSRATATQCEST